VYGKYLNGWNRLGLNAMGRTTNVAGTGYKNSDGSSRRNIIRRFVRENMPVTLSRDPHNINAVAVYVSVPRLFGLLGTTLKQIGYLKASAVISLAKQMDMGESLTGRVGGYHAPPGKDLPKVSLVL
jgi:hypothetical protein